MPVPTHGPIGIGIPGRQTGDSSWNVTPTLRIEDYDEAPPLFPELVLAWFSDRRVDSRQERNMILALAATGNKYQLDQLEQALKIQFPDDEIRYHDDRTGKQHDRFLGGVVDEEDEHFSGHEEGLENNDEYLDALATAQKDETEALASLDTANRTLREARNKQHQVRMARGYFPQQRLQRDRNNERPERKCVICNSPHWVSQCPEKQRKPGEKKGSPHSVRRILYGSSHRNEHVRKRSAGNRKSID